jgi:hypothetical protein
LLAHRGFRHRLADQAAAPHRYPAGVNSTSSTANHTKTAYPATAWERRRTRPGTWFRLPPIRIRAPFLATRRPGPARHRACPRDLAS